MTASRAGRLAFVLERRAKAIELRPQPRGAFAFGVERGGGAIEVAAQPAGGRFALRDPRALLREGVLQLLDPATGGGARLALFVERTPDVVGLLTQTRNRGPFLFELASGLLDLEPGGVDVGFEHGATCALALQRVLQLLELAAGRRGGRASLFEHLPIVVRLGAQPCVRRPLGFDHLPRLFELDPERLADGGFRFEGPPEVRESGRPLFLLQLHFERLALRGRHRLRGGDAREIEDEVLERTVRIRLGERRLERRKARIELGPEGVELSLSGGGEVLSDRFGQGRQPVERRRDCGSR